MITFKVTPDNGEVYEVEAGSRDVLRWERTTKGKSFGDLAESVAMGDMYRLSYLASTRLGLYEGKESEFEATCEVDVVPGEAPDPTP